MLTEEPQLKQKITEIESTVARIKQISGHLRYQNKVTALGLRRESAELPFSMSK